MIGTSTTANYRTGASKIAPRLDHVIVNVIDRLEEAVENYLRMGFSITPRGRHSLGSCNHLAIFGDSYLELFGYEAGEGVEVPEICTDPMGLMGLAFKGENASTIYDAMEACGLNGGDPLHFSRPVDTSEGPKNARFSVVGIPAGCIQNGRAFFCCHHTPELVWMPPWQNHRNGARAITGFHIASADPERTAKCFRAIFGSAIAMKTAEGLRIEAGTASIHILRHQAAESRFGGAIVPLTDGEDRMVALSIETTDMNAAMRALREGGVSTSAGVSGVIVPNTSANGVAIEFVGPRTEF